MAIPDTGLRSFTPASISARVPAQTVAIDLPLKALVWEDASAQVWLGYNDTDYLARRHDTPACAAAGILAKAVAGLAAAAVAP